MPNPQKQPNSSYKLVAPPPLEAFTPEWAIFRFLEPWTPEDLELAIKKDLEIDLRAYMNMVVNYVCDELLKKFELYRSDLHSILSKRAGKEWLKRKIRQAMTQT